MAVTLSRTRLTFLAVALLAGGTTAGLLVANGGADPHAHAQAPVETYVCPMHPAVVKDGPGTCPICGMKLVKAAVPPERSRGAEETKAPDPAAATSEVDGLGLVDIDPTRQQLIGLRTANVDRGVVGGSLRTVARVSFDETRVRRVNVKVAGFVEKLFVDYVGKEVRKGQPLYSLYSPELLNAEHEYLLAAKVEGDGGRMLASARKKLELWGVPHGELERLDREKTASSVVTFFSSVAGVVTKKEIVEGSRVEMGAMPFEVVDLSTVWVLADIYETELRFVAPGMTAALHLDAWPGRTWQGKVLFIDPVLDPKSRTAKVRLAFTNPQGELRPEMYGDVTLARAGRETLRLPSDAVVQSGTQQVVFVARGEGRFEPRRIETGETGRDFTEVISGLTEGEAVITRANFLVDSESRLRASLARIGGKDASAPGAHEAHR
ncbi:MAG: efflux RND transporter periplasmic adaptor subunit [Archangium sp.]|nr:efflux RND transporter periplasmic adaptor subunit [Archangium sp.]